MIIESKRKCGDKENIKSKERSLARHSE
jgi:hypothetical protein